MHYIVQCTNICTYVAICQLQVPKTQQGALYNRKLIYIPNCPKKGVVCVHLKINLPAILVPASLADVYLIPFINIFIVPPPRKRQKDWPLYPLE